MKYYVKLKDFEGPMDLLLHLINKEKIDIKDIFVSEITNQYLEVVRNAEYVDMEEVSEFLVMAATLIMLKSRSLLPNPKKESEEEDSPEAFIQRLEEYKLIKEKADSMKELELLSLKMYQKLPEEYPFPPQEIEFSGLSLNGLVKALNDLLKSNQAEEILRTYKREIYKDRYSVRTSIKNILNSLKKGKVTPSMLLSQSPTKSEVATVFIALLEVIRTGKAHIAKGEDFDDIVILAGRRKKLVQSA